MGQEHVPSSPVEASSFSYVVGVDIGSQTCNMCVLKPDKSQALKPVEFANATAGFALLVERLERLNVSPDQILIGLEATSPDGENLYHFLGSRGYQLCLLHPRQTHHFAQQQGLWAKTDRLNASTIARALLNGEALRDYLPAELIAPYRELVRLHSQLSDEAARYKNEIQAQLSVLFPEFSQVFADPFRATAVALLKLYPSAQAIETAGVEALAAKLDELAPRNYGHSTAEWLVHLAQQSNSSGVALTARSTSLKILCDQLEHTQANLSQLEQEIEKLHESDAVVKGLKSVPEFGTKNVAVLSAELGDGMRFQRTDQVVAYAGLDIEVKESGKWKGQAKLSRLGSGRLQLVFLLVISLLLPFILVIGNLRQEIGQRAATPSIDYTQFVNMVQGPGMPTNSDRQVFMRYPLGRVGLWSRAVGEIADSVTRGVMLYPTVDQVVNKDNTDWRGTIIGTPSETDITYRSDVAAKGSTVALTVTPNVSIYRYHFNHVSSYAAVAIKLQNPYDSSTWTNNTITVVDNQTIQATLGNSDRTIYYYIKFSVPAIGRGTFIGSAIADGSSSNAGANNGGYLKFHPSTPDVTVAVALSHSSMAMAQQFFTNEFSDFNFAAASQRLKDAWNAKLGKIDVQNADQITKQMVYTGLYTVYANIINATDGSPYAPYAAAYGSPVLTIGSSPGFENVWYGYLRCQWDQARNVYALLTLIDPGLMTDILHTYQAQYDLNKVMLGNWDPYCTGCWNDIQWGFFGGMFLRAYLQGVTGVDYIKAKNSIADTFGNTNNYMYKSQYFTKGYIAANGGPSEYMSRGLEFSTQLQELALLANALGDKATYNQYIGDGQNYKNNWDAANKVFRGKNSDGSWAAKNTGFFEGSDKMYAFDVVQDPLGLADLYGDSTMTSQINTLLKPNTEYNDYEPTYQILPIYSNSPSTAQNITRNRFVPQFKSLNMWDEWWTSDVYYTDNAGAIVLAILGLYPIQAPGAQWVITSPSVTTAVIHGIKDTIIQANNNSTRNTYISSIQVNGATYPSFFISGKRLVTENTTITLGMSSTPSRIGNMYVTGTDGEALAASTDNNTYLQFQNDPIALTSRAKIYATKQPTAVSVNGTPLTNWTYDSATSTLNIKGIPAGNVLIRFGSTGQAYSYATANYNS